MTSGERGKQLTGLWITMGASKHCRGRRMAAGDLEKSQQCHEYFLQYSIHLLPKDLRFGTNTGVPKLLLASGAIKARYAHGWSFVRGTKATEILPIWRNWFSTPFWQSGCPMRCFHTLYMTNFTKS